MDSDLYFNGEQQVIEGSLETVDTIKEYSMDIDYTNCSSIAVGIISLGKSNFFLDIYDEKGNLISEKNTQDLNKKVYCILSPSSSEEKMCKYKVVIKSTGSNYYNSEFANYKIIVDKSTNLEKMLSGKENKVYMGDSTKEQQRYCGYYTPKSENGDYWLRFTPSKVNNTIIVKSSNKNLRFKLYDASNEQVMYDSNVRASAHKTKYLDISDIAVEKDKFQLTVGHEYYIVVYNTEGITSTVLDENKFLVYAGEPLTRTDVKFFPAKISATGTYSTYSSFVPISISDVPTTAMVTRVSIGVSSGGNGTKIGAWQVKTPAGTTAGQIAYYLPVEYTYDVNSSNNTKLAGDWNVRYKATKSGNSITIVPSLQISYTYECGD